MTTVFIDCETRSPVDLGKRGAHNYARHPQTDNLVWTWAVDEGSVRVWSPEWCHPDGRQGVLDGPSLRPLYALARDPSTIFVAWNATFDRLVWNNVMVKKYGAPPIPLEQWRCAMAKAQASVLPGGLMRACEALKTPFKKHPDGKLLISQLCKGTRADWVDDEETRKRMRKFRIYAHDDIPSMRAVWNAAVPVSDKSWAEYHASERINDRGVEVDVEFAACAAVFAAEESAEVNERLQSEDITGDPKMSSTAHIRKARWLYEALAPCPSLQLTVYKGEGKRGPRYSCDETTRRAVLNALSYPETEAFFELPELERIRAFINAVDAANSAAVHKYTAIVNRANDEQRLCGLYRFHGASTGRFAGQAVQPQNLVRDAVVRTMVRDDNDKPVKNRNYAIDAMEMLLNNRPVEEIEAHFGLKLMDILRRLLRCTFVAGEGKMLVWGDLSQIEARVLAWLADSPGSRRVLDVFASGRDIYTETANQVGESRQIGKVATLALGFGGSVGAFSAMAKGYGVVVDPDLARRVVDRWREENAWAPNFWYALKDAAVSAIRNPGTMWPVGRVTYAYHPTLMNGTLLCELPSGRMLCYPQIKLEPVTNEETGRTRLEISYMKAIGGNYVRVGLWYGILAENITQAAAADFLRELLVKVQDHAVFHTHDEAMLEVEESEVSYWTDRLKQLMLQKPEWAEGLPVDCEVDSGPFYTK